MSTDNAQVDGHITPIAPKVQAFVARVLVDDNQHVKAGDTLVVLDDRDLKVRLQQAEADLASARAATAGGGRAPARRGAAPGAARSAPARRRPSRPPRPPTGRPPPTSSGSRRSPPSKIVPGAAARRGAGGLRGGPRQRWKPRASRPPPPASQVAASGRRSPGADARLAAAEAAVDNARLQVGYTVLTAPADGIVAERQCRARARWCSRARP